MNSKHIPVSNDPAGDLMAVQDQARRYMTARYGESVWFKAPETFPNMLERWIWAVASGHPEFADSLMTQIEDHLTGVHAAGGDDR